MQRPTQHIEIFGIFILPRYPYGRIEDAYYAWRAEIRASAQGRVPAAMICQTLDEFIVKSTGYETLAAA